MQPEAFAAGYPRDKTLRSDYPDLVEALLVEPREWSHRWGVLLHDALAERRVPRPEEFERFSVAYCGWVNARLPVIAEQLTEWVSHTEDLDTTTRVVMEW